jgi:hypothetical protein
LFTTRLATSARRASFDARRPAGRMDRVPARSDRLSLHVVSLVRGARRARPPPFVPRGTASASPRSSRARRAGDASGRPAFCAGTTGHAWGAIRRRPRSIRPMSAAHGFCSQGTFRDAAQVSMHAAAHSHALGELPVHAVRARFGEPARGPERCLLRFPPCRRTSDASSPRGHSRRSCVHRRRPAVVRFAAQRPRVVPKA